MSLNAAGFQPAQKVVFRSDALPAELDEASRRTLWHDLYFGAVCPLEVSYRADRPFRLRYELARIGGLVVSRMDGTLNRVARTPRLIVKDGRDHFMLTINRGPSPWRVMQLGREQTVAAGAAVLLTTAEPGVILAGTGGRPLSVMLPRKELLDRIADAEDLIATPLDPTSEPLRHLRRYFAMLLEPDGIGCDRALNEHIAATLIDLAALALGARHETAGRGLRAARVREIVAQIRVGFADPSFSPRQVAQTLGVAQRTVQDLLQRTGSTFSERVRELRLQKARGMLASRHFDHLNVTEITYGCGFGDVSYFNRRFRSRFGASPTQFRNGAGGPALGSQ